MSFISIIKDNNKRKIYFLDKHIFTYKKGFKLFSKYTTCNYKNKYFLNHIIKSHKKSHQRIFDYLKKYLYALDNDLGITVTPSEKVKIWQLCLKGNNTAEQNNRMPLIVEITKCKGM